MKAKRNSRVKKGLAIGVILLLGLFWQVPVAWAGEFKGGEEVIIGPDEVIGDDLYVGAGTIIVEGTIKGDLIATGGEIVINGVVEEDFWGAAGYITINGEVQGDVRMAGSVLILGPNAQIADDVFAAGYSLQAVAGSDIGGSLYWAGYQAMLAGEIEEDVNGAMSALDISGVIKGNVAVEVGEPNPDFEQMLPLLKTWMPAPMQPPGFRVTEESEIGGRLTYISGSEGTIAPEAEIAGGVVYQTPVPPPVEEEEAEELTPAQLARDWSLDQLRRFIALLLIGLILLLVVPGPMREAASALQTRPWSSLGWGILVVIFACIAVPVIAFAVIALDVILGLLGFGGLVVSITGLGLLTNTAIIAGLLVAAGYITKVVFSFLVGRMILERIQGSWGAGRFWPLLIGVVLFSIVRAVPYLGWFFGLVVTLLGLGALWLMAWESLRCRAASV